MVLSPAGASSAPTGTSGNTGNTGSGAVITPLLKLFEFGNTVGLPLLCSDAGSIVSILGTQTGGASVSSKLVTELDSQCNELASKGGNYLQQAIAQSRALTLINPVVNPLIADLGKGAEHRRHAIRRLACTLRPHRRRARRHRRLLRGFVT